MTKTREITISLDRHAIQGSLSIPARPGGIVLFAHGSGSSRFSPRNRYVAESLQQRGLATLLMDLLTQEEEEADRRTRQFRFNIHLLADRLVATAGWVKERPDLTGIPAGYFGSSTGAAAALIAAARHPAYALAVVSRGGRPDLAAEHLPAVEAPTLLIVGGNDFQVIDLNQVAFERLNCTKKLEIVPGATHLFEEPGKLEIVARLAGDWFGRHLRTAGATPFGR